MQATIRLKISKCGTGALALVAAIALTCAPAAASDIPAPKVNSAAAGMLPEAVKSRGEIHVVSTFGYAPQQYFGEDGKTPLGNCTACFLKSSKTLSAIFRDDPSIADWWIRMEETARPSKPSGASFRIDRPNYRQLRDAAVAQRGFDFGEADELAECHCTE